MNAARQISRRFGVRKARVKSWLALSPSVSDACYYSVYPELSLTVAFPTAPLHRKLRFWLVDHRLRSVFSWVRVEGR